MWCMHSISSVKSDFLGSTTTTCENMLRSRMDAFLLVAYVVNKRVFCSFGYNPKKEALVHRSIRR